MAPAPMLADLHRRSVTLFLSRMATVAQDDWSRPTPCADWDVRTLVNHVVGEERWTKPLLEGSTIADVGDRLDGDLLGAEPHLAATQSGAEAVAAFAEPDALGRTVHLSFGDTPAPEYAAQLIADHVIHAWDLAAATGGDRRLPPELVTCVADWFADREELYRGAGAIGERPAAGDAGDPQDRLLVAFGRDPSWAPSPAQDVVRRFGAAWEAWDLEAALACLSDDAVFESTGPAPDGTRVEGIDAIRAAWTELFTGTERPRFRFEESFVCGDRASARWRFDWAGGHVRGTDVIRVRDGKVVEKLSYVKG